MSNKILNSSIDELDSLLIKEYTRAVKDLYILLSDMYSTILGEDGKPLLSHLYAYNRYYSLINKTNNILKELGVDEEKTLSEGLENLYRDNEKILNKDFNLSTKIDEEQIKRIINEDWVGDGSNFSDRVWKDKANMANRLKSNLIQSIITGQSPSKYNESLKQYLNKEAYYPTQRLMRTEMARIQNRVTLDKYKEAGVTKVKILVPDDDRTCEECLSHKDEIVDINDESKLPLYHVQCRCTFTAVV